MKKITLFAVAALAASQAFAAAPSVQATKMSRSDLKIQAETRVKKADLTKSVASRADEEVQAESATYYAKGAMYLGLDDAFYQWNKEFGFVSSNSQVDFVPVEEYDGYAWEWSKYVGSDEYEQMTSEDQILSIPTIPFMNFTGPTLKGSTAGVTTSYNDSIYAFRAGGSPDFYGFQSFNGTPIGLSHYGKILGLGSTLEASIDKTAANSEDYNAQGTCVELDSFLVTLDPKVVEMSGYGAILEGMNAPFLLKGAYIYILSTTKSVVPLDVVVYPLDEEGKIDVSTVIGRGTAVLPEGEYADFLSFDVEAVMPELPTVTTGAPVVIPETGAYVSISGVKSENVEKFNVVFNASLRVERDLWTTKDDAARAAYRTKMNTLYPSHAILEIDITDQQDNTETRYISDPWLYGNSNLPTKYWMANEYCIYFIVELPVVSNATQGFERNDYSIEIAEQGGTANRYFETTNEMTQLIDDEYVQVEKVGDWFEYEIVADEEYETIFEILAAAEALPEGMTGRSGSIHFTGYGYDFTISVIQGDGGDENGDDNGDDNGEEGSISNIVVDKAAQGKVVDLQGRVVKNATKGIFIVDGQKVILK